jgi:DNA repair protein RadC
VLSRLTVRETPRTVLQERFIHSGFKGLDDQQIIELVLSLVMPRRVSHRLAKVCLERFKDLRGFLAASPKELEQIGVAPSCEFFLMLLRELPAEILRRKVLEQPFQKSSKEVFDYLNYSMRDLNREVLKVMYLNNANQIIDTVDLFEGMLESIPIRPREIAEDAIAHGASAIIFVHNHPSGNPEPSRSDKQFTRDMVFCGNILQIVVLDHIIIAGNKYYSFADEGLIKKYGLDFLNFRIRMLLDSRANYGSC